MINEEIKKVMLNLTGMIETDLLILEIASKLKKKVKRSLKRKFNRKPKKTYLHIDVKLTMFQNGQLFH